MDDINIYRDIFMALNIYRDIFMASFASEKPHKKLRSKSKSFISIKEGLFIWENQKYFYKLKKLSSL